MQEIWCYCDGYEKTIITLDSSVKYAANVKVKFFDHIRVDENDEFSMFIEDKLIHPEIEITTFIKNVSPGKPLVFKKNHNILHTPSFFKNKKNQTIKFNEHASNLSNENINDNESKISNEVVEKNYNAANKLMERFSNKDILKLKNYFLDEYYLEASDEKHRFNYVFKILKNGDCKTFKNYEILNFKIDVMIPGFSKLSSILVRDSYKQLFERITSLLCQKDNETQRILVTGTPGIGKSMFAFYFIYRILNTVNQIEQENFSFIYSSPHTDGYYYYDTKKSLFLYDKNLIHPKDDESKNTIIIVDGDEKHGALLTSLKTILICSPGKIHCNGFLKVHPKVLYMPVWFIEEIIEYSTYLNMNQELVETLFLKWGGIPRYIIEYASHSSINDLQNILEEAIFETDYEKISHFNGQSAQDDQLSSKILHMYVENLELIRIVFASDYVKNRAINMMKQQHFIEIARIIQQGGKYLKLTANGDLFEHFGHLKLTENGTYDIRPILIQNNISIIHGKISMPKRKIKFFDQLPNSETFKREGDVYYQPNNKSYPAIDSFSYPNELYNFTLNEKHNITVCNELENVIDLMLLESSFINFYFFVHSKNYCNFQLETDCFTYSENKLYEESTASYEIRMMKLEEIKSKIKSVLNVYLVNCDFDDFRI